MSIFEAGMMVCFGISWPVAAYKTYKAKCVHGKSIWFSLLILLGLCLWYHTQNIVFQRHCNMVVYYKYVLFAY